MAALHKCCILDADTKNHASTYDFAGRQQRGVMVLLRSRIRQDGLDQLTATTDTANSTDQ